MRKTLTNITTGKVYINWCYTLDSGKVRKGRLDFEAFEIKQCDFIDDADYEQMVRQNDHLFETGRIIDSKISDSKKDQKLDENIKKSHKKLKENAQQDENLKQEVTDNKGQVIGNVQVEVKEDK